MLSKRNCAATVLSLSLVLFAGGCKKKVPPAPPPPPAVVKPTPPTPTQPPAITQFTAEPSSIERGQSATLRWSVSGATEVAIDAGIGVVQANGNRTVFPSNTTSYTLTAKGPGGQVTRNVSVNVAAPTAPPPPPAKTTENISSRLANEVQDVYFDYDKSDIREDARGILTKNADALKAILTAFAGQSIVVEGHADERGSAEYNLGLGDRRATAAKEFLVQLGVPGDRLKTISYGRERPQCTEQTEQCNQRNRRAHFAPAQ